MFKQSVLLYTVIKTRYFGYYTYSAQKFTTVHRFVNRALMFSIKFNGLKRIRTSVWLPINVFQVHRDRPLCH